MDQINLFGWKKGEVIFTTLVLLVIFGISFYQLKIGEMKTRDMQRRSDLNLIRVALLTYRNNVGVFPLEATGSGKIFACGDKSDSTCEWGGGPLVGLDNTVFMNKIPADVWQEKGQSYMYETDAKREHFKLYTALENRRDKIVIPDLTKTCGLRVQCNWYVED